MAPGLFPGAPVSLAAATQREMAFRSDLDISAVFSWLRLRPPFVRLALVAWLIVQANVLYLEGCLSYCLVHSVIAKHNMLAMPSPKPSG